MALPDPIPSLNRFSMLIVNNNRSKAYLQTLIKERFVPERAILLEDPKTVLPENERLAASSEKRVRRCEEADIEFDEAETVAVTLDKNRIPYETVNTVDINSGEVIDRVRNCPTEYLVYSGPGGFILKKELLSAGKIFIHVHAGWLPEYRGSTAFYYSLLAERSLACSVIFFEEELDGGPVFLRRRFVPGPTKDIDLLLDPAMRAATLIEFFKSNFNRSPKEILRQDPEQGNTFYIIHPVLKHLAILSGKKAVSC